MSKENAAIKSQDEFDNDRQNINEPKGLLVRQIELDTIRPNPHQPRKRFSNESIEELARSIEWHGLLQPISVQAEDDGFIVIAGERRLRAHQRMGLSCIDAVVINGNPRELALVENVQREDLHPLDLAGALKRLQDDYGYKDKEIAEIIGKSRTTVNEILRINSLPDLVKDECRMSDTATKSVLIQVARGADDSEKLALWKVAKKIGSTRAVRSRRANKKEPVYANKILIKVIGEFIRALDSKPIDKLIFEDNEYKELVSLRDRISSAIVAYEQRKEPGH